MQQNNDSLLWQSDLGNGQYRNPVLFADYSDPDVIRVGDTFYMTASSFNQMPGLPILISKDLVNWQLVNHAVKRLPYAVYDRPQHGKGIFAPSLRYHDGRFWIVVCMPDEGVFVTSAEDPLGEWTPLTCLKACRGFIDTCPLWAEDGRTWIVHAYAKSRIGFNSVLGIFEVNSDLTECLSEDRIIFDGTVTQPVIEGPKTYQRNGFTYIFAPAGGVPTGWQTVLRSRSVEGPYEEKIVLHQGNTDVNGPHQGGLVDTPDGEEWFVHFQDRGVYGRIIHLQPVVWEDDWPMIGIDMNGDGIGEPVSVFRKPSVQAEAVLCEPGSSDDFSSESLRPQWQWQANPQPSFHSLSERRGSLCLYALNTTGKARATLWDSANILTQKVTCPQFTAEALLDCSELVPGDRAGLLFIGGQYAALYAEKRADQLRICYVESSGERAQRRETVMTDIPLTGAEQLRLSVTFTKDGACTFRHQAGGHAWSEPTPAFTPGNAFWVGAKFGLFAIRDGEQPGGKAFFGSMTVTAIRE